MRTRYVVWVGFLIAVAFALEFLEVPLPFLPPYLRYDLGDLPALLAALALGPAAGAIVEVGKEFLFFLSGRDPLLIGMFANMLAGVAWVLPAALVYRTRHGRSALLAALVAGALSMNVVMFAANGLFVLRVYGLPQAEVWPTVLAATTPFNLIKTTLTTLVAYAVYRRLRHVLRWRPEALPLQKGGS